MPNAIILFGKPYALSPDSLNRRRHALKTPSFSNDSTNIAPLWKRMRTEPMIKAEIDAIIAAEHCQEQLAPVEAAFEAEKAKILGSAQG